MRANPALFAALVFLAMPAGAAALEVSAINDAQWSGKSKSSAGIAPVIVKAQVLLDRAHFSPGEIDGKPGENFKKAISAFAASASLSSNGELNDEIWQELAANSAEPVITDYTMTDDDVRGPFLEKVPTKMEDMKDLPALPYTGAREKIAEKFHMSEALLAALNPGQTFDKAGATIKVVNIAAAELPGKVARLEVNKTAQTLKAFDRDGTLLAFYPVTSGSPEKPAPSGRMKVTGVSKKPTYRYNPDYAFKGVRAREPFTIKPGPNNPVGSVWIGLSGEGYGIHGTPDPSKVSKSESHGCIRMTNWDALQLASAVRKGMPVDFIGDERAAREAKAKAISSRKQRRRR
jgi:lipoprotein-anchoring transpeptidase ErfK/SrfK